MTKQQVCSQGRCRWLNGMLSSDHGLFLRGLSGSNVPISLMCVGQADQIGTLFLVVFACSLNRHFS